MRRLTGVVLVVAACIALAACGSSGKSSSGPIHVGFLTPLSGPAASVGQGTLQGAQLAVAAANKAGGVDGRKIILDVVDSQFSPQVGAQATTRFARNQSIPLMIGSVETVVLNAQQSIAQRQHLPTIALVGTGPPQGASSSSSYIIYPYPACDNPLMRFAKILTGQGKTKWAGIGWSDVAAEECLNAFEKGIGSSFTAKQLVPLTATDMSGPISNLQQSNPQGVAVMASGPTPGLITQQAAKIRFHVPFVGWGGYEGYPDYPKVAGASANGFELIGSFAPDLYQSPQSTSFVSAYKAKYNSTPTEFNAAGYDAALIAIAALKNAGTDRTAIHKYLFSIKDFPAAAAKLTITPSGGVVRDMYVQRWENGTLKGLQVVKDGSTAPSS